MAFTKAGTFLHDVLTDVSTAQHHTATVAADLNLADLAERAHTSLTSVSANTHHGISTQAELETEASTDKMTRPDRVRFSPGVAKAHCRITAAGALVAGSYNVASVTDTATGDRTIVFDDDFSADTFSVIGAEQEGNTTGLPIYLTHAVGSVRHVMVNVNDQVFTDIASASVAFGDQ